MSFKLTQLNSIKYCIVIAPRNVIQPRYFAYMLGYTHRSIDHATCFHEKTTKSCPDCNGTMFCEHSKYKYDCYKCSPYQLCRIKTCKKRSTKSLDGHCTKCFVSLFPNDNKSLPIMKKFLKTLNGTPSELAEWSMILDGYGRCDTPANVPVYVHKGFSPQMPLVPEEGSSDDDDYQFVDCLVGDVETPTPVVSDSSVINELQKSAPQEVGIVMQPIDIVRPHSEFARRTLENKSIVKRKSTSQYRLRKKLKKQVEIDLLNDMYARLTAKKVM